MGMKIRIANCGTCDLVVQSSGRGSRALNPLSFGAKLSRDYVEFDVGDNEILFLRPRDTAQRSKVRLANCGDRDLIVQNNAGHRAMSPLGFGERIARRFNDFDVEQGETLILRPRGARDFDNVPIRSPV